MENLDDIIDLAKEKRFAEIKSILLSMAPIDIAEVISELPDEHKAIIFRLLPKELSADTFVELDSDTQELLIRGFTKSELQAVIDELFVDDTVDIIEEMPAFIAKRILDLADTETRREINEILQYPSNSAGSIMTTEFVNLKSNMTVEQAFDRIRKTGVDKETVYTCYVTDDKRVLLGVISIRTMLFASYTDKIGDLMETSLQYAYTLDDKEEVAKQLSKYDFIALPVVDREKRLVGIITVDDAMDVLEDEANEDMQIMGALAPIDDTYLKTSVFEHWKKRIVWLLILMISGIASGLIIDRFESAIAALPLLVAFIPRLMDTGGNCGSQSSTLIIRGLATDEIEPRDILKIVGKEIRIALITGLTLAVVNVGVIWLMYGMQYPATDVWYLCLSFGLTIFVVVILAKLLGCSLPILAKKLHLDPALMASPIITTLVDIFAVTVYFTIALTLVVPNWVA